MPSAASRSTPTRTSSPLLLLEDFTITRRGSLGLEHGTTMLRSEGGRLGILPGSVVEMQTSGATSPMTRSTSSTLKAYGSSRGKRSISTPTISPAQSGFRPGTSSSRTPAGGQVSLPSTSSSSRVRTGRRSFSRPFLRLAGTPRRCSGLSTGLTARSSWVPVRRSVQRSKGSLRLAGGPDSLRRPRSMTLPALLPRGTPGICREVEG